jgi:hypothetical protein
MAGWPARALRRLSAGLQQVLLGEADENRIQGAGAQSCLLAELIAVMPLVRLREQGLQQADRLGGGVWLAWHH